MRSRVAIGIVLIVLSIIIAIFTVARKAGGAQEIPIVTHQLSVKNGIVPVELQCRTIHPSKRPELLVLSCTIKNNTDKTIGAFSINYAIIFEGLAGREFSDSGFMTLDTLIHPDFEESHVSQPIPPQGDRVIDRGEPIRYENATPKRIEANLDYVQFEDNTGLGPDLKGSKSIALIREGAARYKEWLKQKYLENGKLISAVAPLLQDSSKLQTELQLNDTMLVLGASAYQKKARDLYRARGSAEIERLLNK